MTANIGTLDRLLRIVVGIGLLTLLAVNQTGLRWIGLAGFILIGTAVFRVCPLYTVLRVKTR